jgi:NAD(P)-dependent dehydrogenase (short-subunit alcohol dehydrogenase family)
MRQDVSSGNRALLTSATGLIGAKLAERLADVIVLSRDPERARRKLEAGEAPAWSPEDGPPVRRARESGCRVPSRRRANRRRPVDGREWRGSRSAVSRSL